MAKQNSNPPPWEDSMSDGCSGVPDWLPIIGDMTDDCDEHDEAYYYGGTQADKDRADKKFRSNLRNNADRFHWSIRWLLKPIVYAIAEERFIGVRLFADSAFNWEGPGLPKKHPPKRAS